MVAPADTGPAYRRRQPETESLYQVMSGHLETFLAQLHASDRQLPSRVEHELRAYLACGIPAHGFLRVRCQDCGTSRVVAISCKKRGFCPSCMGRRMADTAARLLWERGVATVEEIRDDLPDDLSGSTVRTLLQIMHDKGHVGSTKRGKANVYGPLAAREQAQTTALRALTARLFQGSARSLMARLVEEEEISLEELDALRRTLGRRQKGGPEWTLPWRRSEGAVPGGPVGT